MAKRRRRRAPNDGGSVDQRPSGRWRLRVHVEGRQTTYGQYETEEDAFRAQARWRLTHLLPADDPELAEQVPASVAVGGVRCDEWFERWQQAKGDQRSMVRLGAGRGGAPSTAARDRAQWRCWWMPALGDRLPHTLSVRIVVASRHTISRGHGKEEDDRLPRLRRPDGDEGCGAHVQAVGERGHRGSAAVVPSERSRSVRGG